MAESSLIRMEEDGEQIATEIAKLAKNAVEVVSIAGRTYQVPRDENGHLVRPDNMTDEQWHLHVDAMQPARSAPLYLTEAYRRVETTHRIVGGDPTEMPRIAGIVGVLIRRRDYPVIDVTPIEDK
jgi:hypothetical protein